MNKNKLIIGRALFTLFVVVAFGLIIMNEKGSEIFSFKVEEKMNEYIETNYSNLSIIKSSLSYKNNTFTMQVKNKKKNHLSFQINYHNKKITDTYEEDYVEGKSLFNYLNTKLEKEVKEKTNETVTIKETTTLDEYSSTVREKLLAEENLLELKYYYIKKEITVDSFEEETISKEIESFIKKLNQNKITPKYYKITITDKNDLTKSVEINNISEEIDNYKEIISDILNDNNSELLKEYKITYKYLN